MPTNTNTTRTAAQPWIQELQGMVRSSMASCAADKLGELRAQIADLAVEAKALEQLLKGEGEGTYRGNLFEVTVSRCERATTDWKALVRRVHPMINERDIENFTRKVDFDRVTVTARKKAA